MVLSEKENLLRNIPAYTAISTMVSQILLETIPLPTDLSAIIVQYFGGMYDNKLYCIYKKMIEHPFNHLAWNFNIHAFTSCETTENIHEDNFSKCDRLYCIMEYLDIPFQYKIYCTTHWKHVIKNCIMSLDHAIKSISWMNIASYISLNAIYILIFAVKQMSLTSLPDLSLLPVWNYKTYKYESHRKLEYLQKHPLIERPELPKVAIPHGTYRISRSDII